jgi:glycine hydroxymethyltransferase
MSLSHGGHLTHGNPASFSGKLFKFVHYGVDEKSGRIDHEAVSRLAKEYRPKLIVAGASSYPRIIDFEAFSRIAEESGAYLMVDMAHIAGLVAAGLHPSPVPYSDVVTSTTHKTLRGPRGGLILARNEHGRKLSGKVFPGIQGGPLMHVIAAKAMAFLEALSPAFRRYQEQVVRNAKTMADHLMEAGLNLVSSGTDNHMLLVDLRSKGITGREAEKVLERAGITVNKNAIPFDPRSPAITSGIRIGTPAVTTRGMKAEEMAIIARLIVRILENHQDANLLKAAGHQVRELCSAFPLYKDG